MTNDRLMLLATCATTLDTSLAVGAELSILGSRIKQLRSPIDFDLDVPSFRAPYQSGLEKLNAFFEQKVSKFCTEIASSLPPVERSFWNRIDNALRPALTPSIEADLRATIKAAKELFEALSTVSRLCRHAREGTLTRPVIAGSQPRLRRSGVLVEFRGGDTLEYVARALEMTSERTLDLAEHAASFAPINSDIFEPVHSYASLILLSCKKSEITALHARLHRQNTKQINDGYMAVGTDVLADGRSVAIVGFRGSERQEKARQFFAQTMKQVTSSNADSVSLVEIDDPIFCPKRYRTSGPLVLTESIKRILPKDLGVGQVLQIEGPVSSPRPIIPSFRLTNTVRKGKIIEHEGVLLPTEVTETKTKVRANTKSKLDVAVLTILPEEGEAARRQLGTNWEIREVANRDAHFGRFVHQGIEHSIGVFRETAQGNLGMSRLTDLVLRSCRPRLIILLGRAGALKDDVQIKDVVCATRVLYYEPGAITPEGLELDPDQSNKNQLVLNLISELEDRTHVGNGKHKIDQSPVWFGPIASGDKVVKSLESELVQKLIAGNRKLLAVEMEAAGFASSIDGATTPSGRGSAPDLYLVIRGISDKADVLKDDDSNSECCMAAARFAELAIHVALDQLARRSS
jgi:nucleoside phosphorylase